MVFLNLPIKIYHKNDLLLKFQNINIRLDVVLFNLVKIFFRFRRRALFVRLFSESRQTKREGFSINISEIGEIRL